MLTLALCVCLIVYIQLCVKDPNKICFIFQKFKDFREYKSLFLGVFKLKRLNGQRPQSVGEK